MWHNSYLVRIVINGEVINNIRSAEDTVLLTRNFRGTHLLGNANDRCNEDGLKINFKKTKLIVVTKFPQNLNHIYEPDGGTHHDREGLYI